MNKVYTKNENDQRGLAAIFPSDQFQSANPEPFCDHVILSEASGYVP